ncbi:hypothetical protein RhiTH_001113 [Rhizoctonia solani]
MPREKEPVTQRLATATGVGEAMVYQLMNSTESPSRSGALTIRTWGERLVLVLGLCHSLSRSMALHKSNYVVLTGAQAIKIEFDHSEENAVARRVSCCFKSKSLTAKARKNVVLPAGILLTPQLLELGGVGNGSVLKKHKISLNVDLPLVGENYEVHILVLIIYKLPKLNTINANYLSKQIDQSVLVESIKFANKIAKAESLATKYVTQQNPSADMKSDKDFSKRVKGNDRTLHHSAETAAMAPKLLRGVVNAELKVHASVIMMHLAAHLHHTAYGIAERAADVIKSDSGF